MAIICLFDVTAELFNVVPNWRRRQFLILDELIKIVYGQADLWYKEVAKAMQDQYSEDTNDEKVYNEILLIREHYGPEMIDVHSKIIKKGTTRPLSQNQKIISSDKKIIFIYYLAKILLFLNWRYGKENILDSFLNIIQSVCNNISFSI